MLKNILFAVLTVALCFNVMQVACPLTAQGLKAVKIADTQPAQTAPNAKQSSLDRTALRVEHQVKRLAKDLELTEKQVEDVRKLYTDIENKQAEFRQKITDLNKEKQTKLESLLTDGQKQKINERKSNTGKLQESKEKLEQLKLKAATPATQQAKPVTPSQEEKK